MPRSVPGSATPSTSGYRPPPAPSTGPRTACPPVRPRRTQPGTSPAHLEWNQGPATVLLGELIRDEVLFRAGPFSKLKLAKAEAEDYDAAPKADVWEREGVMLVPGRPDRRQHDAAAAPRPDTP